MFGKVFSHWIMYVKDPNIDIPDDIEFTPLGNLQYSRWPPLTKKTHIAGVGVSLDI